MGGCEHSGQKSSLHFLLKQAVLRAVFFLWLQMMKQFPHCEEKEVRLVVALISREDRELGQLAFRNLSLTREQSTFLFPCILSLFFHSKFTIKIEPGPIYFVVWP